MELNRLPDAFYEAGCPSKQCHSDELFFFVFKILSLCSKTSLYN